MYQYPFVGSNIRIHSFDFWVEIKLQALAQEMLQNRDHHISFLSSFNSKMDPKRMCLDICWFPESQAQQKVWVDQKGNDGVGALEDSPEKIRWRSEHIACQLPDIVLFEPLQGFAEFATTFPICTLGLDDRQNNVLPLR